jgi:hypothetical protein
MFPELNRERLRFLFRSGVTRQSLKRFLDQRKPALEMRNAQYRKRSRGPEADLTFLINLPDKCIPIVRAWCLSEMKSNLSLAPEALIAQFQALEKSEATSSEEEAAQFAGIGLRFLFEEPPSRGWMDFLKSPIGAKGATETDDVSADNPPFPERSEVDPPISAPDLQILQILQRLRNDDGAGARELIARLPESDIRSELDEIVRRLRSRPRDSSVVATEMRSLPDTDGLEPEKLPVLVRRKRQARADQPIFLEICGLMLDGGIYRLTEEQVLALFEGREVMAFPGEKSIRPPEVGELSLWFVERYPTDRANKYRLRKPAGSLYTVVELAAAKDDFDQVRTAIQQAAIEPTVRAIFHLAGGGFIRPHFEASGAKKMDFDKPLDYYQSVPVWNVHGIAIVTAPLPPADSAYDCADLSVITARVLRESEVRRHLPEMTGFQVNELIESLRASDMGLTEQRLGRIGREFDRYITSAERLREICARVLESETVRTTIQDATENAKSDAIQHNQELRDERSRLERKNAELKNRGVTLTAENKKIGDDLRVIVRKSFEKAKESGIKSLGDIAVFASLIDSQRAPVREASRADTSMRVWEANRVQEPPEILIEAGVSIANSRIMSLAARCISGIGLPIVVIGSRAAQVAVAIGRGLARARCVVCDVSIGAMNPSSMGGLVDTLSADDSLVLRNYNLSAVDAYGITLIDLLVSAVAAGSPARAGFVFSASSSPAGLPINDDIQSLAVVINSTVDYAADAVDLDTMLEQLREDRTGARMRNVALSRMLSTMSNGQHEDVHDVLAVIAGQQAALTRFAETLGIP